MTHDKSPHIVLLALLYATGAGSADTISSTWVGTDNHNWSVALNWNPQFVPQNGGGDNYLVSANSGLIYVDGDFAVTGLTLDPAAEAVIQNSRTLHLQWGGTVANDGLLRVGGTGSTTRLQLQGEYVFVGSGVLQFNDVSGNQVFDTFNSEDRFVNGASHTVAGGVGFFANVNLTNHGLIDANGPDAYLRLQIFSSSSNYPNFNDGVIQARNGGLVSIDGSLDNTGGLIQALDESAVRLQNDGNPGNGVKGGEFDTQGSGEIRVVSGNHARLFSLMNSGSLVVQDSAALNLAGAIVNNGTIEVDGEGNNTWIVLDGTETTLTGNGDLQLKTDGHWAYLNGTFAQQNRLTNDVSHTIHGHGNIGWSYGPNLTNLGLIDADVAGKPLDISPVGDEDNYNQGVMQASDGGILRLESALDNSGGVIQALDASEVRLQMGGNRLRGGLLDTQDSGRIRIVQSVLLTNVTNNGVLEQEPDTRAYWSSSFTNNGMYTLMDESTACTIMLRSDIHLGGGGELVMQKSSWPSHLFESEFAEQWTLTNGPDHTIRGKGQIGAFDLGFTNLGRVLSDAGEWITVAAHGAHPVANHGVMQALDESGIYIRDYDFTNNSFTNHGSVLIEAGSQFLRAGGSGPEYVQADGETVVDGQLSVDEFIRLDGGALRGAGSIDTPTLINAAAKVAPGASPGTLTLSGDFEQQADGVLAVELAGLLPGSEHDQLLVAGHVLLGGTLEVRLLDGYLPQVGDTFTIIDGASSVAGAFDGQGGDAVVDITYEADRVIITFLNDSPPGDLNTDGCVDQQDLGVLLSAFGSGDDGDVDGDGDTDQADLGSLLASYGAGC